MERLENSILLFLNRLRPDISPSLAMIANTSVFIFSVANLDLLLENEGRIWLVVIFFSASCISFYFSLDRNQISTSLQIFALSMFLVQIVLLFGEIYLKGGIVNAGYFGGEKAISRVDAIYFSIVTMTTLGYGDFQPEKDLRLVAAFQGLLGYTFLALFVTVLTKKQ